MSNIDNLHKVIGAAIGMLLIQAREGNVSAEDYKLLLDYARKRGCCQESSWDLKEVPA